MSLKNRKKKIDVLVGADHGGVALKDELLPLLTEMNLTWKDVGTFGPEAVDYPDIAFQVARAVAGGEAAKGLLVCGSGIGMAITANRVPGVRAAVCNDLYSVRVARSHNDANILALGGRMIGAGLAREIVATFMTTAFEKGRHLRRIRKMEGGCS